MRLGKKKEKERDTEPRSQNVDGISRLICSAKTAHTAPMRGIVMKMYIFQTRTNLTFFFFF